MNTLQGLLNRRREDGWWYPWLFVAGMGLVVVVNGIMITIALSTWTGLETSGHYEKGLAYNENLQAAEAQAERGWRFDFVATPLKDGAAAHQADLRVTFADHDGHPLDRLEVKALLIRPTHEGYDQEIVLIPAGGGVYEARADLPLPGQWKARILAFSNDAQFQEIRRFTLP